MDDIIRPALDALSLEALKDLRGKINHRITELELGNFVPSSSCNRHANCAEATAKFEQDNGRKPGFNFHCHDDECEDCFGC